MQNPFVLIFHFRSGNSVDLIIGMTFSEHFIRLNEFYCFRKMILRVYSTSINIYINANDRNELFECDLFPPVIEEKTIQLRSLL